MKVISKKKNNLKHLYILCIFVLILFNCNYFRFGLKPANLEKSIEFEKGQYVIKDKRLKVKYVITGKEENNSHDDIIFYFHGFGRSELEWVEENGFGKVYYDVIKSNPEFYSIPVVSISLGGTFLFVEDAPAPFSADIETLFIEEIVPYFQNKLNKKGNVYLIGHSMGGFNALMLSLRNPSLFRCITAISPFVAPISPYSDDFQKKGEELKMSKFQVNMSKKMLTFAFPTEKKWLEYNPFYLVEKYEDNEKPYIFLSSATEDLPGFSESIDEFSGLLKKARFDYNYCSSKGDHKSVCFNLFYGFLDFIEYNNIRALQKTHFFPLK